MPRLKPLTIADRIKAETDQQRDRVIRIIKAAAEASNMERAEICRKAHIDYQVFNRRLQGKSEFRLPELWSVADVLGMDMQTRAAICGSKEKCRYEPDYKYKQEERRIYS